MAPGLIVLSYMQAAPLLEARQEGKATASTSLDLGLTESIVGLEPEGAVFPEGQRLSWESIEKIKKEEMACFVVRGDRAEKAQFLSERLNRFYSLMPTQRAPTMLLSGFPMHRIKKIDPHEDTLRKIRTVAPVAGSVLDTATGLGYTAIEAAKTADRVVTIEIDPTVLEVARLNPWSQPLFSNPRIEQVIGNAFEVIRTLEDEFFLRIFHYPPTIRIAGELYSGEFYRQLFRVLKRNGRLFHYIGNPESDTGHTVAKGVVRRLQDAGFARIIRKPEAFGLVAYKGFA